MANVSWSNKVFYLTQSCSISSLVRNPFICSKDRVQKIGSRSSKPNHFLPLSKWCICMEVARIHLGFPEKSTYKGPFWLSPLVTLKIGPGSPEFNPFFFFFFFLPIQIINTPFDLNPSSDSRYDADKLFLIKLWHSNLSAYELLHDKTNKMAVRPAKTHPPSLISLQWPHKESLGP